MSDLTATTDTHGTTNDPAPTDLLEELRNALPDLDRDELNSLAQTVYAELELRVGQLLSTGLSTGELEEFSTLMDAGNDQACTTWLAEHRPDYQVVVRGQLDAILAETVAAVRGTPGAADELVARRHEEILDLDIDVIAQALRAMRASVVRVDDRISITRQCTNGQQLTVTVKMAENGLLSMQSDGPTSFPQARKGLLLSFAQHWNRERYWPKAFVVENTEGDTCRLVSELAYPLAPGVHRRLLVHLLGAGVAYTKRMFESFAEVVDDPAASAQLELF